MNFLRRTVKRLVPGKEVVRSNNDSDNDFSMPLRITERVGPVSEYIDSSDESLSPKRIDSSEILLTTTTFECVGSVNEAASSTEGKIEAIGISSSKIPRTDEVNESARAGNQAVKSIDSSVNREGTTVDEGLNTNEKLKATAVIESVRPGIKAFKYIDDGVDKKAETPAKESLSSSDKNKSSVVSERGRPNTKTSESRDDDESSETSVISSSEILLTSVAIEKMTIDSENAKSINETVSQRGAHIKIQKDHDTLTATAAIERVRTDREALSKIGVTANQRDLSSSKIHTTHKENERVGTDRQDRKPREIHETPPVTQQIRPGGKRSPVNESVNTSETFMSSKGVKLEKIEAKVDLKERNVSEGINTNVMHLNQGEGKRSSTHVIVESRRDELVVQEEITRDTPRHENLSPSVITSNQQRVEHGTSHKLKQKLNDDSVKVKQSTIDESVNTSEAFINSYDIKLGGKQSTIDESVNTSEAFIISYDIKIGGKTENKNYQKANDVSKDLTSSYIRIKENEVKRSSAHGVEKIPSDDNIGPEATNRATTQDKSSSHSYIPTSQREVEHGTSHRENKALSDGSDEEKHPTVDESVNTNETLISSNVNQMDGKYDKVSKADEGFITSDERINQRLVKHSSSHRDIKSRRDYPVNPAAIDRYTPRHESSRPTDIPSLQKEVEHESFHKTKKILSDKNRMRKGSPVDESVNTSETLLSSKDENKVLRKVSNAAESDNRINQVNVQRSSAQRVVENKSVERVITEAIERDTPHGSLRRSDIPATQRRLIHDASHKIHNPVNMSTSTSETFLSAKVMKLGGKNDKKGFEKVSSTNEALITSDDRINQGAVKRSSAQRVDENRRDDRVIPEAIDRGAPRSESFRRSDIPSIQREVAHEAFRKVDNPVEMSTSTSETFLSSKGMKLGGKNDNKGFQKVSNADEGLITSDNRFNQGAVKRSSAQRVDESRRDDRVIPEAIDRSAPRPETFRRSDIPSLQREVAHEAFRKVDNPVEMSTSTSETFLSSKGMKLGGKNDNKGVQKVSNADEGLITSDNRFNQGAVKRSSAQRAYENRREDHVIPEANDRDTARYERFRRSDFPSMQREVAHEASQKVDNPVEMSTNTSETFLSSKVMKLGEKNDKKGFEKVSNEDEGLITSDDRFNQAAVKRSSAQKVGERDDGVIPESIERDTSHGSLRRSDIPAKQRAIDRGAPHAESLRRSDIPSIQREVDHEAYRKIDTPVNMSTSTSETFLSSKVMKLGGKNDKKGFEKVSKAGEGLITSDDRFNQDTVKRSSAQRAYENRKEDRVIPEAYDRDTARHESLRRSDILSMQREVAHEASQKVDNPVEMSTSTSETFLSSKVMKLGGKNYKKGFEKVSNEDEGLIGRDHHINQGAGKLSSAQRVNENRRENRVLQEATDRDTHRDERLRRSDISAIQREVDHEASTKVHNPVNMSTSTSETFLSSKVMKLGEKNDNKGFQKVSNAKEGLIGRDQHINQGAGKRSSAQRVNENRREDRVLQEATDRDTPRHESLRRSNIPSMQREDEHEASQKMDTPVNISTSTSETFLSSKVMKLGMKNDNKGFQRVPNAKEGLIGRDDRSDQEAEKRSSAQRVVESQSDDNTHHRSLRPSDIPSTQKTVGHEAFHKVETPVDMITSTSETFLSSKVMKLGGQNNNKVLKQVSKTDERLITSDDRIKQGAVKRSSAHHSELVDHDKLHHESLRRSDTPSIQRAAEHEAFYKDDTPVGMSANTSETFISSKVMKLGGNTLRHESSRPGDMSNIQKSVDRLAIPKVLKKLSGESDKVKHATVDESVNTSDTFISSRGINFGGEKDKHKVRNRGTDDYRVSPEVVKRSSAHRVFKNQSDEAIKRDSARNESLRSSDISSLKRGDERDAYEIAKKKQIEYPFTQEVTARDAPINKSGNVSDNKDDVKHHISHRTSKHLSDSRIIPVKTHHESSRHIDIPSSQRGGAERARRKLSEYAVSQEVFERSTPLNKEVNVSDNRFKQRLDNRGIPLKVLSILSDHGVDQSTTGVNTLNKSPSNRDKRYIQEADGISLPVREDKKGGSRVNTAAIDHDKSVVFQSTANFKVDQNQSAKLVNRKLIEREQPISRAASTSGNRVTKNIKSVNESFSVNNIPSQPRVRSVSVSVKRANDNLSKSSTVIMRVGPVSDDDGLKQKVTNAKKSLNISDKRNDQRVFKPGVCVRVGKIRNDGRENRSVNEALYASELRRRIGTMVEQPHGSGRNSPEPKTGYYEEDNGVMSEQPHFSGRASPEPITGDYKEDNGVMNEQLHYSGRASPELTTGDYEEENDAKDFDLAKPTSSEMDPNACLKLQWYWAPVFITCWLLLYFCISIPAYNHLPTPLNIKDERKYPDTFIAQRAHINLKRLTNHRRRTITNEVAAIDFFKKALKKLKAEASANLLINVDVQKASGTYIHEQMIFMYQNVQNFVVKISTKNSSSNSYLLVKSHFDSVLGEQDNDDVTMVAIMLEALRVLSRSDKPLKHPVVFLFNVATQNSQQGAHAFITTHKWAKKVKALINLDPAGSAGHGLLFQTGPKQSWLMKQYRRAIKHPHASTVAQEMFKRLYMASEKDNIISWEYARVPGLHMVYQYNGYVCPEIIPLGALQNTGDNVLSMVRAISNAPEMSATSPCTESNTIFFDVLGTLLLSYSETEGIMLNIIVAITAMSAVTVSCHTMASNTGIVLSKIIKRGAYLMSVHISAIVAGITLCFVMGHFMEVMLLPMSWLSEPWLIIGLYFCTLFFGLAIVPVVYFAQMTDELLPIGQHVQLLLHCHCVFLVLMTLLLTMCRIRSAFLIMIALLFYSMSLIINLATKLQNRPLLWVVPHIICATPPFIFFAYLCHGCFVTIIPMTGSFGAGVNPELIICALTVGTGLLTAGFLIPLLNLFRKSELIVSSLLVITAIFVLIAATPLGFPYRPNTTMQRFTILHTRRIFHDTNKEVRRQESGYLIMPNNRLRCSLEAHALQMPLAQSITADCESEMLCGQPFYNERWLKSSASSRWLSGPVPKFDNLPHLKVIHKTAVHDNSVCYDLLLEGPQHMTLFIRPLKNSKIIAWSFHLTPLRLNWSPPYFVYLSYGTDKAPLNIWLQFEKTSDLDWSDEYFEIGVSSHRKHHDHLLTKDAKTFIRSFPKYAHVTAWPASYEAWVF